MRFGALESLVPWAALEARVDLCGYRLAVMLRAVQLCYNLSDPALEDALRGRVGPPLLRTQPQWADP